MTGQHFALYIAELAELAKAKSIIDYGCGKGTLEKALQARWMQVPVCDIVSYDPCVAGREMKRPCDLVACTDVLEHIEPECLETVLADMKAMMLRVGFFSIHTGPAMKHLPDGRNAHLIQKPYTWWFNKLAEYFWISKLTTLNDDVFVTVAKSKDTSIAYAPIHHKNAAVAHQW